ncbi:hypothetical protein NDU88_007228 [Pleurodeles waltl]|uniref:Uncharacterized protein n=1 Tax=Pleurodeles waltl TaxID=8319 RepID=A0AAV7VS08_PLEWA|nr:hypothetical protein NDU88_007228 [Pleurodeles waltl]
MSGAVERRPTQRWRRGRRLHVFRITQRRLPIARCSCGGCDHLQDQGTSKRWPHSTRWSCRFCGSLPQHTLLSSQIKPGNQSS